MDYKDIIETEWNYSSLTKRMPLFQRAKIFLPFAALTGYEKLIEQKDMDTVLREIEANHGKIVFDDIGWDENNESSENL